MCLGTHSIVPALVERKKGRCPKTPARRLAIRRGIRPPRRSWPSSRRSRCVPPRMWKEVCSAPTGAVMLTDAIVHVEKAFFAGTGPTSRQQPSDVTWLVAARLGRKRRGDHVHGYGPLSWCGDRTSTLAVSGRIPHRDRLGLWARCRPMVRTFPSFVRFVRFVLLRPGSLHA